MTEVLDDTAGLVAGAAEELGGSREPQGPYSPLKTVERAKRPAVQDKVGTYYNGPKFKFQLLSGTE